MFEEFKFVTDVQNGVSAINHIEGAFGEHPFRCIGHFKLYLSRQQHVQDIQAMLRMFLVGEALHKRSSQHTRGRFSLAALSQAISTMFADRSIPNTSTPKFYQFTHTHNTQSAYK